MEVYEILKNLREKNNLTQEEMAVRVNITRQAVSRWETGETQPNAQMLIVLSREFNVSINTLLGSPQKLICQCCGMPLEDEIIGRNKDGSLNEEYCKWCYADGVYTYNKLDDLIEVCVKNMVSDKISEEQARSYLQQTLPTLNYWKNYEQLSDNGEFYEVKEQLVEEINDLHIEGMPKLDKLNALVGSFVNIEYRLPSGESVKFLDDNTTYLGNQLESEIVDGLFFGVIANMDFILICTYEQDVTNPELLLYKKR